MESAAGAQAGSDFIMAIEAFECRLPSAKFVAGRALCRAVQVLVRAGKRAGRDLRAGGNRNQTDKDDAAKCFAKAENSDWRKGQRRSVNAEENQLGRSFS